MKIENLNKVAELKAELDAVEKSIDKALSGGELMIYDMMMSPITSTVYIGVHDEVLSLIREGLSQKREELIKQIESL